MEVFPEPGRPRLTPLGNAEPVVQSLIESTRKPALTARSTVNDWYSRFPDVDGRFAARLRSEVDTEHHQSLDELFVFTRLSATGNEVRYEEGGRGPDFRVYRDGQLLAGVEVASLFQQQEWTDRQRRYNQLADAVNARLSTGGGYRVQMEPEEVLRQPSVRGLCDFIRAQIAGLPRSREAGVAASAFGRPSAPYTEPGVRIDLTCFPLHTEAASSSHPHARVVAMGPPTGGILNAERRLRDRVGKKAGQYDIEAVPFQVAVGIHDYFSSDDEVEGALFGLDALEFTSGRSCRQNDGLFGSDRERPEGRNRRLSAVAVINQLRVWQPEDVDVYVLHNPYANQRWPDELLEASRHVGWQQGDAGQSFVRY